MRNEEMNLNTITEPEITVEVQGQSATMDIGIATWPVIPAARKLVTPRRIRLTGSADGETMFDGSKNVDIFTSIETLSNEELEDILR